MSPAAPTNDSAETVRALAQAALDKRAEALVVLDLQGLTAMTDYFLLCTARSPTQLDTIADALHAALKVVAHLFLAETRAFYALERLWGDASVVEIDDAPVRGGASGVAGAPSD